MELAKGKRERELPPSPEEGLSAWVPALVVCELKGYIFIFPAAHKW